MELLGTVMKHCKSWDYTGKSHIKEHYSLSMCGSTLFLFVGSKDELPPPVLFRIQQQSAQK